MGSLIDELQRREARPGRIAELAERLAGVEERLSRLVITREMIGEVLSEAGTGVPPTAEPEAAGHPPATGGLTVPLWRAGLEASALPQAYRDPVEVAEDAGRPLRAAQIAAAAGLSTGKAKVETLVGET